MTLSIHETGMTLFPGSGFIDERGGPGAEGTSVNVPLQPYTGDGSWLEAVQLVVPALAEAFRPTFLVTQHGCDTHAYDPLAHLRLTTRAYRAATVLLDEVAHRFCDGRWYATGGGGYDAYRVVPRSWSLVWLAQAHLDPPGSTDVEWRDRWATEAEQHCQAPPPELFLDPEHLVGGDPEGVAETNRNTAERALSGTLELLGKTGGGKT
jgi:acetoin utilization protein AcuC